MRKAWGCDKPTPHAQDRIPCMSCDGNDADCSACHGDTFIELHDCPRKVVDAEVLEGVRSALRAKVYNIWPVAGGTQDQSRSFVQLFDVVSDEVSRIEADEMKKRERASR